MKWVCFPAICIGLLVAMTVICGTTAAQKRDRDDRDKKEKKEKSIDFEKHIKPIFKKHCISCHGPKKQESKFRVDRRKSFLQGGDYSVAWVIPGKSSKSRLIAVLKKKDEDVSMPPSWAMVPAKDIETIKRWIDQGAKMPEHKDKKDGSSAPRILKSDHWSLQKVSNPKPPLPKSRWSSSPIDRFIQARLTDKKLSPSASAKRHELIRRLYLVMLGVPPTPEQVDAFVKDRGDRAWERLVAKVLADKRYGERWAQHWLDIARFGETDGFETNRERPNAWRYRDWVIQSLNDDKPYDKFVKEQIAGDILGEPIGTGFLVCGPHDIVKSPDINLTLMQRQDELADVVHTTATAFLGLTLGCARCHDHKFDPLTQTDYYAIQAVFSGVRHGEREIPLSSQDRQQLQSYNQSIRSLVRNLDKYIPDTKRRFTFVDDTSLGQIHLPGVELLKPIQGTGTNPSGAKPGFKDDPGDKRRSPNLSVGSYSWWNNKLGEDYAVYRPKIRGKFRIWISWGRGFETHTKDANYILDRDGDPATKNDQTLIATVNQQIGAHEKPGQPLPKQPLWSGLKSIGKFEMTPASAILLRGGKTGAVITADMVVFEKLPPSFAEQAPISQIQKPISSRYTAESFQPIKAKRVRFQISKTNGAEPCIDELEVFSGKTNIALANGVKISSSGNYANNPKHKLRHINDGKYGNANSWISNSKTNSWVQLEFPTAQKIDRIVWARDRHGKFSDRTPIKYRIMVDDGSGKWKLIADSLRRLSVDFHKPKNAKYEFRWLSAEEKKSVERWQQELKSLLKKKQSYSLKPKAYIGTFNPKPPPTHRLHRGDPMAKREKVAPNAIRVIGTLGLNEKSTEQQRRLKLAEWIASTKNPLTARVIVNRLWQYHFGTGIVSTASDFGINGTRPTHPELLDWLAADLMKNGWSLKSTHRKILLSKTWQQSSSPRKNALAIDADARLLWRFPPRRLEAESIRDSIVSVTGVLNGQRGGPGFSAFEVQLENVRHYFPKKKYGPEDWRRMVYMTKVRQERESIFGAFDCPDGSQVMPNRSRSTTPLQALNLFNSRFILQQAELFAKRLENETRIHVREKRHLTEARIRLAYRLCYSRNPTALELADATAFIEATNLKQFCRAMLNSNEFLFIP